MRAVGRSTGTQQLPRVRPGRASHARPIRRAGLALAVLACTLAFFALTQANGQGGAALADGIRAVAGPVAAAQVEGGYLAVRDGARRALYQLGIGRPTAPWAPPTKVAGPANGLPAASGTASGPPPAASAAATPRATAATTTSSTSAAAGSAASAPQPTVAPPGAIAPIVSPALPGEGQWSVVTPGPTPGQPLVSKTFWRPDPVRPYALVTLLAFNPQGTRLRMVAGTSQPGGPLGNGGPGIIPAADQQPGVLLAAFNGGFKEANGAFGMMVNGKVYVPPVAGSGTIAVTRQGQVLMGLWGSDPALSSANTDLVAWRQNGPLLINQGAITSLTDNIAAWGQTIGGAYTWRSGIGLTANGTLLYAAGDALSARTLAGALRAAGAVTALQLDINPFWVRAFTYSPAPGGGLAIDKLQSTMYGTGHEYLRGDSRDFFYVTRHQP
ncbi:MAG TPA: phosphodiester glycosidase family protein [Thermomicrobiaceae bacterium]|nr:phosphodiester glycosidase family protein [Thermomicrobiaceae bacterium]